MITIDLTIRGCTTEVAAKFISAIAAEPFAAAIMTTTAQPTQQHEEDDGPANATPPAVDTAGFPWDERIHSTKKATNTDGTWRKRRGVDNAIIAAVEAELRSRHPMPQQQQQPQYTPPMAPPPNYQPQQQQSQYTPPMAPPPNYQPPGMPQQQHQPQYTPPMAPPQQQTVQLDFNGFMSHLSGLMQKRDGAGMPIIDVQYIASLSQRLSQTLQRPITHIAEIGNDPNAINAAVQQMTVDGKWFA